MLRYTDLSKQSRQELINYVTYVNKKGLKSCLYSGRNVDIEDWMTVFDYVKVGSYNEELGPLSEKTTNQKLYEITNLNIKDITEKFWEN